VPIFEATGIEREIEKALRRRVWLKSGGYIVIDHTEALVAIDVNSGKYVGKRDFEETVLKINLEAVTEVVRQIRLRDLGGIIIIDFIDMERRHRDQVSAALRRALGDSDRAPTSRDLRNRDRRMTEARARTPVDVLRRARPAAAAGRPLRRDPRRRDLPEDQARRATPPGRRSRPRPPDMALPRGDERDGIRRLRRWSVSGSSWRPPRVAARAVRAGTARRDGAAVTPSRRAGRILEQLRLAGRKGRPQRSRSPRQTR
jgi:hypothetical protein